MNALPKSRILGAALLVVGLLAAGCTATHHPDPGVVAPLGPSSSVSQTPAAPVVATIDAAFPKRPAFGLTLADLTQANLVKMTGTLDCKPTIVQRFASVATGISAKTLESTSGIPLLSLEPWHPGGTALQSDFTLKDTINGNWDKQYRTLAQEVVQYHNVVLLRFAHEMNGNWYPWGMTNGNTVEDFIAAWRHVVDLFRAAGATNVLWVWSPNILRGATSTQIKQFWPGSSYVDLVGLTGYGVHESNPSQTYTATLKLVKALTDKPVLLSETGAQADSDKTKWISKFGVWLKNTPQVLGFVWFNSNSGGDWRFDDNSADLAAFKTSLKSAGVSC